LCGPSRRVSEPLPLETIACPLCGETRFHALFSQGDLALGVPGRFHLVRCPGCGLLYQNPRVRADQLARAYPAEYAAHTRDPELSRTLRHMGAAVRWVLSKRLGYQHLDVADVVWRDKLRGVVSRGRILKVFPPWIGQGRLLDVGCGSGKFLRQMGAVGWDLTGIEVDAEAAARAREVTPNVYVGDPTQAPFPEGSFDLITAFHVIEHLPDPLGALRNMVRRLAPGGLIIVEVPNAAGWGAHLFGRYWSGLDFPRHLVHFTPTTLSLMVEKAGGRVLSAAHRTKPRYFIRSLRHGLADRNGRGSRIGLALVTSRLGGGVLKLILELLMPLARPLQRGEAVRFFIRRSGEQSAWYDAP